jgi:hypothetical protein
MGITETRRSTSRPWTLSFNRRFESLDLWRDRLHLQHAVHTVANREARSLRLDVNIARPHIDGFEQDFIDEANHRRLLGHFGEFGPIGFDIA